MERGWELNRTIQPAVALQIYLISWAIQYNSVKPGYSKKLDNLRYAVALFGLAFQFCSGSFGAWDDTGGRGEAGGQADDDCGTAFGLTVDLARDLMWPCSYQRPYIVNKSSETLANTNNSKNSQNPSPPRHMTQIEPYALCVLLFALVSVIIAHALRISRDKHNVRQKTTMADKEARDAAKKERDAIVNEFDSIVDRWRAEISDKTKIHLAFMRDESIRDIMPILQAIRSIFNDAAKSRFDVEWNEYKKIDPSKFQYQGRRNEITGNPLPYYEARDIMLKHLNAMKTLVHDALNTS